MMPRRCFSVEQQRGGPLARSLTTRLGQLESRQLELPAPSWSPADGAGRGSAWCAPAGRLQGETGAGVHHRRSARVYGGDDLLGGDALQVGGAGRRQVRVGEL